MKRLAALVLSLLAAGELPGWTGMIYNHTDSMPRGWYAPTDAPIRVGSIVKACPPKLAIERQYVREGDCNGGEPLLKPVAALAGDHVRVEASGVWINGEYRAALLAADSAGRPLAAAEVDRALLPGEVFLLSTYNGKSFDSRYFGPVALGACAAYRAILRGNT